MRGMKWEAIGLFLVAWLLAGWLVFFWSLAHHQPSAPPERAIWNDQRYPWERTRAYRVEGP